MTPGNRLWQAASALCCHLVVLCRGGGWEQGARISASACPRFKARIEDYLKWSKWWASNVSAGGKQVDTNKKAKQRLICPWSLFNPLGLRKAFIQTSQRSYVQMISLSHDFNCGSEVKWLRGTSVVFTCPGSISSSGNSTLAFHVLPPVLLSQSMRCGGTYPSSLHVPHLLVPGLGS